MFKILALDPGSQHIGTAISDELGITATPYQTVTPNTLINFLRQTIINENINTIIIGFPKTMRGTASEQTQQSILLKDELAIEFPTIKLILWDERLSSQQASQMHKAKDKAAKTYQHSIAAAIILQNYLDGVALRESIG